MWFVAVGLIVFSLVRDLQANRDVTTAKAARATPTPSGALTPVGDVDMWRR